MKDKALRNNVLWGFFVHYRNLAENHIFYGINFFGDAHVYKGNQYTGDDL